MRKIRRILLGKGKYVIDLDEMSRDVINSTIKIRDLIGIVKRLANDVVREHLYYHMNKGINYTYDSKEAEREDIKNTVVKKVEKLLKEIEDVKNFDVKKFVEEHLL